MNNLRIKLTKKMQAKFNNFLSTVNQDLSKPHKKALKCISKGILSTGSVIVRRIAQSLDEKISLKKTCKRLYYSLSTMDLEDNFQEKLLQQQCKKLTKDSLVFIDGSDIIKENAVCMGGLSIVRDGSKNTTNLGYDLINFVALTPKDKGYELVPLSSDIYSKELEIDTKSNIESDKINDITLFTNNSCTFVYDRGGDSRYKFRDFSNNNNNFIIRSMGKRGLIINEKEKSFKDVCRSVKLKYTMEGKKDGWKLHCGTRRVKIRLDPHPKKKPETIECNLVVCRHINAKNEAKGFFYFLCNFPSSNLSKEQIIKRSLISYKLRWKIEETHREVKQDFCWEGIQLLSYQKIKNMNTILWMSICFLYSCKNYIYEIAQCYPSLMLYKINDLSKLTGFSYYRIKVVIKVIFSNFRIRCKSIYKGKYHDNLQMKLKF